MAWQLYFTLWRCHQWAFGGNGERMAHPQAVVFGILVIVVGVDSMMAAAFSEFSFVVGVTFIIFNDLKIFSSN